MPPRKRRGVQPRAGARPRPSLRLRGRARLRRRTDLRLHLGCRNVHKPGWVDIDSYSIPPCTPDLTLDLRQALPFPDASCAEVYSEHFFEHITYPEGAAACLKESFRVLRPGGVPSMGVPDPISILAAYLADRHTPYFDYFLNHPNVRCHLCTPMEAVNWLFRQGGEHQFIYDYPSLEKMLLLAGFQDVARREWDPARDSECRRFENIYVDARKPA
jgi:predicted SAM-dependent methyltransferase